MWLLQCSFRSQIIADVAEMCALLRKCNCQTFVLQRHDWAHPRLVEKFDTAESSVSLSLALLYRSSILILKNIRSN